MVLNLVTEREEASADFEEAARLTHKEAAEKARRYWQLKQVQWITDDAELITPAAAKRELERLNAELKKFIEENEPVAVEGLPPLVLQDRNGPSTVDVKSLAEHDPETFARLLDSNALVVNMEILNGLEAAQLVGKVPRMPGPPTRALLFDKRGWTGR